MARRHTPLGNKEPHPPAFSGKLKPHTRATEQPQKPSATSHERSTQSALFIPVASQNCFAPTGKCEINFADTAARPSGTNPSRVLARSRSCCEQKNRSRVASSQKPISTITHPVTQGDQWSWACEKNFASDAGAPPHPLAAKLNVLALIQTARVAATISTWQPINFDKWGIGGSLDTVRGRRRLFRTYRYLAFAVSPTLTGASWLPSRIHQGLAVASNPLQYTPTHKRLVAGCEKPLPASPACRPLSSPVIPCRPRCRPLANSCRPLSSSFF